MTYLDDIAAAIGREVPEAVLPQEPSVDRLLRSYAVLLRAKGADTLLRDIHDAWAAWMIEIDPAHVAIRPFEDLDEATQQQDVPFLTAVQRVAERNRGC